MSAHLFACPTTTSCTPLVSLLAISEFYIHGMAERVSTRGQTSTGQAGGMVLMARLLVVGNCHWRGYVYG